MVYEEVCIFPCIYEELEIAIGKIGDGSFFYEISLRGNDVVLCVWLGTGVYGGWSGESGAGSGVATS